MRPLLWRTHIADAYIIAFYYITERGFVEENFYSYRESSRNNLPPTRRLVDVFAQSSSLASSPASAANCCAPARSSTSRSRKPHSTLIHGDLPRAPWQCRPRNADKDRLVRVGTELFHGRPAAGPAPACAGWPPSHRRRSGLRRQRNLPAVRARPRPACWIRWRVCAPARAA